MTKKIIISIVIVIVLGLCGWYLININCKGPTDGEKFAKEYEVIDKDNVFVYRTKEEIINILKNGTGVVYLGFPECPWCKEYIKYLNEVAKENNLDKIYYLNILNDRKENTKEYLEIVDILKDYLQYGDEGTKRIYVPSVLAVSEGKIVGFDDETSYDTKGYKTPAEYWQNEDLDGLKNRLKEMFNKISVKYCTDCN